MSPSGLFSRVYIPTPHNLTHAYRGVARHTCSYILRAKPRPCVTPKSCPSNRDKKPRDSFLLSQVTSIQTRERAHEKERDGGTERGKKRHGSLDMQLLRRAVTRREGGISLPAARYTHMQTCAGSLGRCVSRAAHGRRSLARSLARSVVLLLVRVPSNVRRTSAERSRQSLSSDERELRRCRAALRG